MAAVAQSRRDAEAALIRAEADKEVLSEIAESGIRSELLAQTRAVGFSRNCFRSIDAPSVLLTLQ